MRASSFAALFVLPALLTVAAGCGHRGAALPPQPAPGMAGYERNPQQSGQLPQPFATPAYGVGLSIYSGGPAGGPYLYGVCDRQVAFAPATPSPSCWDAPNLMRGVATFSKSVSHKAAPCLSGAGTCSTSAALTPAMGSLAAVLTESVGPGTNPTYQVSEGLVTQEFFLDSILLSDPSVPTGTMVTIKATLTISGTFNPLCGLAANVAANPIYRVETDGPTGKLRGSCLSGKFVKTVMSPDGSKTWTGTTWSGQVKMPANKTQNIDEKLYVALDLLDCKQAWSLASCLTGTVYGSMKPVAHLYIQPVTSGVTLSSTSGHNYLPPTP